MPEHRIARTRAAYTPDVIGIVTVIEGFPGQRLMVCGDGVFVSNMKGTWDSVAHLSQLRIGDVVIPHPSPSQ